MLTAEGSETALQPRINGRLQGLLHSINSHPRAVMFAAGLYFLAASGVMASLRLFWLDEFITLAIARQGSFSAIWQLLGRGADPNPPLSHLAALGALRLLGGSELAVRAPFLLASLIGVLCLFALLARRIPPLFAACAVLFYTTTHAFDYAFEARSYSLLLCFSGLSLLAWRWSFESRHPRAALLLMSLSLALGLASNYYGVLAFFPIAAGELAYSLSRRPLRLRWMSWCALALSGATLLLYLPLINVSVARFTPYAWNKPTPDFISYSYTFLLDDPIWLAVLVLYGAAMVWLYERTQRGKLPEVRVLPLPEFTALTVLIAYPVLGYAIAVVRAGMISPRCVVPYILGVAAAVAIAGYRLFHRSAITTLLFVLCCMGWSAYRMVDTALDLESQREAFFRLIEHLPTEGVLAVPDSLLVLPLHHYAPQQAAARMVFPVDLYNIRRYKREDSAEQNLTAAAQIYPVPLVPLPQLVHDHPEFTIVAPPENWLLRVMYDYGEPPRELPTPRALHNLRGFFSLSFGDCRLYQEHFGSEALRSGL